MQLCLSTLNMKNSIYNCRFSTTDGEILLNAYTLNHIKVDSKVESLLSGGGEDYETFSMLVSLGFLVPDDLDEVANVKEMFLRKRIQRDAYSLVVNTTLDCNLRCSYCYEKHVRGSRLSDDMIESIGRHLTIKHAIDRFKSLTLTLFGGETLLDKGVVRRLIGRVTEVSEQCGFEVAYTIVTNATLLDAEYVELFRPYRTSFQVTLDGLGGVPDGGRRGAFNRILSALQILNNADCFSLNLRINYDAESIREMQELLPHIDFLNRSRTSVSLCKIWQADGDEISKEDLLRAINVFNGYGFIVSSFLPVITYQHCYADNYSEAVLNYDGNVYKCTARDFTEANSCGRMTEYGFINWKSDKVLERLALEPPKCCDGCKIMPFCPGHCSQEVIEARKEGRELSCSRTGLFSVDELIEIGFKQILLRQNV